MLAERILEFYTKLHLDPEKLSKDVDVLNPYADPPPEIWEVIKEFYRKYYSDTDPRGLILGINPGRLGAGATGIPFTDSYALEDHCKISFPGTTRESSAGFVYMVIDAYGGPAEFYKDWFIGAASPLGFVKKNKIGNWVNWNYYDSRSQMNLLLPFIQKKLKEQSRLCQDPGKAVVLGTGKNYKSLVEINKNLNLFEELIPLEHPRYIMQYKRRFIEEYIRKFVDILKANKP